MNAYWAAQLEAIWSGEPPLWEAEILDDTEAGHILVSDDDEETWRLARMDNVDDVRHCGALALQTGRAGETIKMTSRGKAVMQFVAPDYTPLRIGQVGEDGIVALDFSQDGA